MIRMYEQKERKIFPIILMDDRNFLRGIFFFENIFSLFSFIYILNENAYTYTAYYTLYGVLLVNHAL